MPNPRKPRIFIPSKYTLYTVASGDFRLHEVNNSCLGLPQHSVYCQYSSLLEDTNDVMYLLYTYS